MKKIFIAVVVLLSFNTIFAQGSKDPQLETFLLRVFPKVMPSIVMDSTNQKTISKEEAVESEQYLFTFRNGAKNIEGLRQGEKIALYDGIIFYSFTRDAFIEPATKKVNQAFKETQKQIAKSQKPKKTKPVKQGKSFGEGVAEFAQSPGGRQVTSTVGFLLYRWAVQN